MTIEWDHVGRDKFERCVEALAHRTFAGAEVIVVNGRGGDDGIDILVTEDGRSRILQLKYFPQGFSNGFKPRRTQITSSFNRAMVHNPTEWTLVVPATLTHAERRFVKALGTGKPVKVTVMDRSNLDSELAAHPELEASFNRDSLREMAQIYGQERAVLDGGARDLAQRVSALGRVVDSVDQNWTFDFSREGSAVVQTLRPLHPLAAEVSPVSFNFNALLDPAQPELQNAIERSLGYGTQESVTLPGSMISNFQFHGPEWMNSPEEVAQLTWTPLPNPRLVGKTAEIVFLDEGDRQVARHSGQVVGGGTGSRGHSLEMQFYGLLNLELLMSHDDSAGSTFNLEWSVEGHAPSQVIPATRLYAGLLGPFTVEVSIEGRRLVRCQMHIASTESSEAALELQRVQELAIDLDLVQRETQTYFPMPAAMSGHERVWLRAFRLMLEGKRVRNPFQRSLWFTLSGQDSPEIRDILAMPAGQVMLTHPGPVFEIGDVGMQMPEITVFGSSVTIAESSAAVEALASGSGEGLRVEAVPNDGHFLTIFMGLGRSAEEHIPQDITPLGLPGFN